MKIADQGFLTILEDDDGVWYMRLTSPGIVKTAVRAGAPDHPYIWYQMRPDGWETTGDGPDGWETTGDGHANALEAELKKIMKVAA